MKTCKVCGEAKSYDEFYRHHGTKDKLTTICKSCCKSKDQARYHLRMQDPDFREMKCESARKSFAQTKAQKNIQTPITKVPEVIEGEIWRECVGTLGLYQVSNLGRICSTRKSDRFLIKPSLDRGGYHRVMLYIKGQKPVLKAIHRLVAEAFIPNPENMPMVNHLNAIKTDNRVVNLEWATHESNTAHAKQMGLYKLGNKKR